MFDREWGGSKAGFSRSVGPWVKTEYEAVESALLDRAQVADLTPISDAARLTHQTFEQAKKELLPTLDALLSQHDDKVISEQRQKLAKLESHFNSRDLARSELPSAAMTRDTLALGQGFRISHHRVFKSWLMEQNSYGSQAAELADIARYVAQYLEKRLKMKGKSIAKTDGNIFIGHGRSKDWNEVKDFVRDRLKLSYDEFNREAVAGLTPKERLLAMLDNACFAFLVMTAEDEHADGSRHARENVIHEIGLFQGRLGFERAIMLLEEGCEEFSNIVGVQQIRFAKGNLSAHRDAIRHVLEREGIIKAP